MNQNEEQSQTKSKSDSIWIRLAVAGYIREVSVVQLPIDIIVIVNQFVILKAFPLCGYIIGNYDHDKTIDFILLRKISFDETECNHLQLAIDYKMLSNTTSQIENIPQDIPLYTRLGFDIWCAEKQGTVQLRMTLLKCLPQILQEKFVYQSPDNDNNYSIAWIYIFNLFPKCEKLSITGLYFNSYLCENFINFLITHRNNTELKNRINDGIIFQCSQENDWKLWVKIAKKHACIIKMLGWLITAAPPKTNENGDFETGRVSFIKPVNAPDYEVFIKQIFIQQLNVRLTDTIQNVKKIIHKQFGVICAETQRLIVDGKQLNDEDTLADYNITKEGFFYFVYTVNVKMEIFVKTLADKYITFNCKSSITIKNIKTQIEEKENIPCVQQKLIYGSIQLIDDDKTLYDYNIRKQSILNLVVCGSSPLIFIKALAGQTFTLDFDGNYTIKNIKEKIEEKEGISWEKQKLIYVSKLLEDNKTLDDYSIMSESILYLVMNLELESGESSINESI
eukprot:265592_1